MSGVGAKTEVDEWEDDVRFTQADECVSDDNDKPQSFRTDVTSSVAIRAGLKLTTRSCNRRRQSDELARLIALGLLNLLPQQRQFRPQSLQGLN